jgi:hypothetical protein
MIPSKKSIEKHPQNDELSERKYHEKALKITEKMGRATRTLEESRQTLYTHNERFIEVIACLLNIHPLSRSHHEALKLVIWKT